MHDRYLTDGIFVIVVSLVVYCTVMVTMLWYDKEEHIHSKIADRHGMFEKHIKWIGPLNASEYQTELGNAEEEDDSIFVKLFKQPANAFSDKALSLSVTLNNVTLQQSQKECNLITGDFKIPVNKTILNDSRFLTLDVTRQDIVLVRISEDHTFVDNLHINQINIYLNDSKATIKITSIPLEACSSPCYIYMKLKASDVRGQRLTEQRTTLQQEIQKSLDIKQNVWIYQNGDSCKNQLDICTLCITNPDSSAREAALKVCRLKYDTCLRRASP